MEVNILQNFNNREIALGIWATVFTLWALYKREVRSSLGNVIKSFFAWKLSISYIAMLFYISIVISVLYGIGIWNWSLTISTLLWVAFGAFTMLFNFKKASDENYIEKSIKEHLRVLVLLEFLINFYVFSLLAEIIILPIITIVGVLAAFSESKEEYEPARKLFTFVNASFGICLTIYVILMVFIDFSSFFTFENLRSFIVPILLSVSLIPFIYLLALYSAYRSLFTRLSFFVKEKAVHNYARKKILSTCGINLKKLNEWSNEMNQYYFDTPESVDNALNLFIKNRRRVFLPPR